MRYILRCYLFLVLIASSSLLSPFSLRAEAQLAPDLTVMIPMRDGQLLSTDLYYPEEKGKSYPCVLVRSPAGRKAFPWCRLAQLSSRGYIVAMQDTRSALDTDGRTLPFITDGWGVLQDGYDTVEWLAKSPHCNGKVVTAGWSAAGITQLMLGPAAPPSLVGQHIGMATGSLYHHAIYPGGKLLQNQVELWLGLYARDPGVQLHVEHQPRYNPFWQQLDSIAVADRVEVPALFYTGWYDTFLQGTVDAFKARQERGKSGASGKQKLVIGPWGHYGPVDNRLGDFHLPEGAYLPPIDISPLAWFDSLLQEEGSHSSWPVVSYYVMGPLDATPSAAGHRWAFAEQWPPPCPRKNWLLSSERKLVAANGERWEATIDRYRHDPLEPVPTLGGWNLFFESGPKDQQPLFERKDLLTYSSEPLDGELQVTGTPRLSLVSNSSSQEWDLIVRFCDLYPNGQSIPLSEGVCHLKRPIGTAEDQPLAANIELLPMSAVFAKGHRLQLIIASSSYPRYAKGDKSAMLYMGQEKLVPAQIEIHSSPLLPSQLELPIMEMRAEAN